MTNSGSTNISLMVSFLVSSGIGPGTVLRRVFTVKWPITLSTETLLLSAQKFASVALCSSISKLDTG